MGRKMAIRTTPTTINIIQPVLSSLKGSMNSILIHIPYDNYSGGLHCVQLD